MNSKIMKNARLLTGSLALLITATLTVSAQTLVNGPLVNDTFSGLSLTGGTNSLVTASGTWRIIQGTDSAALSVGSSGVYGHNALKLGSHTTDTFYRAFDSGTTLTLDKLATGQAISITLNIAFGIDSSSKWNSATFFDFGLINYSTVSSEQRSLHTAVAIGNTSTASGFYTRPNSYNMTNANGAVKIGNTWTETNDAKGAPKIELLTDYKFTFTITKQESNYLLEYFRDSGSGSVLLGSEVSALTGYTGAVFSGVALRFDSGLSSSSYLDSITVSIIPEPSVLVLLGTGFGLLAWLRRKRG